MGADDHDLTYYFKCMIGGMLGCGATHTAVVPLDVVKCRKQINKDLYKSMFDGLKTIYRLDGLGPKGLYLGFSPTLIGYSL